MLIPVTGISMIFYGFPHFEGIFYTDFLKNNKKYFFENHPIL